MKIPLVDLKAQYGVLRQEIDSAIADVIYSTQFIQGEEVRKFEKEFANYVGSGFCVGVNSGTDALILGMRALQLSSGDEVIVPANTFISTALAASENGLKPVFVDIDENDFGINLNDLISKITVKTKAIIAVHLRGQPDKISEIQEIIRKSEKKIYLIEDACQAHGAEYRGKKVGTFGVFSAFSFYPGKNLGAYGDGGAITTNDKSLAQKLGLLREYGQSKKYYHDILGVNSRLDEIQAAVLRIKLKYLDESNKKRQKIAGLYSSQLSDFSDIIKIPKVFKDRQNVFHLYIIRTRQRDALIEYLNSQGIQSLIHYPVPLHLQKAYGYLGYKKGDFPIVEKVSSEILSLPLYPEMTDKQVAYVTSSIKLFFKTKHI